MNRTGLALTLALFALVSPLAAPELLAFPYRAEVGDTVVRSDRPIPAEIATVLACADERLRTSPLYEPGHGTRVFLTDGGWRWRVLALTIPDAFAFVRPITEAVVVNDADVSADLVRSRRAVGNRRRLSDVIAHERTHLLVRSRYGRIAELRAPAWLKEGYADHVAGSSTLSDAEAAALRARGEPHSALGYYDARKRVEAALAAGKSVDDLFAGR